MGNAHASGDMGRGWSIARDDVAGAAGGEGGDVAAVQRSKTNGQLIDESLDFYGIKSREDARDRVRRAGAHAKLDEAQALLAAGGASPVAGVLDGMLNASFPYAMSECLLGEYRAVLLRPALRKLHGLSVGHVEHLLVELVQHAIC